MQRTYTNRRAIYTPPYSSVKRNNNAVLVNYLKLAGKTALTFVLLLALYVEFWIIAG
jgi:hypothetical protein